MHCADLGLAENLFVPPEHLAGDRVAELLPLAEDGELLTDLGSPALPNVQIERAPFDADHEAFEGAEGLDEVVEHEHEGRPHSIGHPGGGARGAREHAQHDQADGGWMPNTPRRRSQISPSVTPASTAATRSGRRLSRLRAAASRPSRARPAASRSPVARARATRSASAAPTAASTWKRLPGGRSSVTYS